MFLRAMVQTMAFTAIMGALLFIPTGDWLWTEAWWFLAQMAVNSVVFCAWLARTDPALLEARLSGPVAKGQAAWDRMFILGVMAAFMTWLALIGLDARRFHWSEVPTPAEVVGAVLKKLEGGNTQVNVTSGDVKKGGIVIGGGIDEING